MLVEGMIKNRRILIVDDSRLTSKITSEFLTENGYEAESVRSGEEALQISNGNCPPDLILMDIELDGEMDGIDAADTIIKLKGIPVIFYTANTSMEIINRVKEVKAYGLILKGMDKIAVLSTVEMALRLHDANTSAVMFDRFFENSVNEMYILCKKSLRFIAVNHAARKNLGYRDEELKNMTIYDINPELNTEKFQSLIEQLKKSEKEQIFLDTIHERRDNSQYPVEMDLQLLNYGDEELYFAMATDLTEGRAVKKELERSNNQYFELAENAPIGIMKCDQLGNIVYVNKKVLEILGSPSIEKTKKINLLTFPMLVEYGISHKLEECLKNNVQDIYEMEYESVWGRMIWMRLHIKPLIDGNMVTGAQIIIDDITEKKQLEEELHNLSITDYLTDIYNRRFFIQKLEEEIERAKRNPSCSFSLVMLDVDHFKNINDHYGHSKGDQVLKNLADTLKSRLRKIDFLARHGGEEFIILLMDTPVDRAAVLAEELRIRVSRMDIPGADIVTASFGVTSYIPGDTSDTIVQRVDKLMYDAKAAGRNCVCSS